MGSGALETIIVLVLVQPVAGSKTVTVYVPGVVTVLAAVIIPPPQL